MKFPLFSISNKTIVAHTLVILALTLATAFTAAAQKSGGWSFAPENDSATLEQCRNGATGSPEQCTGNRWTTGNAGSSNSHWEERQFISYRMLFGGLSAGSQTVIIGYDIIHSGKHAIDYLGTYNYTETTANPCSGVTGCSGWPVSTAPVPADPNLPATVPQIPGVFTFWGATFDSNPTYVACPSGDPNHRCVQIQFTPTAGVTAPVLSWGGHVAWRGEWGAGQSAGGISGSPYHMRLISLNGQGGNQDRSLSAQGVFGPGSLRIVKSVSTAGPPVGTASTAQFFFNATANFGATSFFLVDDDSGPGVDFKLSQPILTFNGTANVITVTEDISQFPANQNWSLNGNPVCVEDVSTAGTTNVANGKTVTVDPEETVVCQFNNTQLAPSAAPALITGRAVDSFGFGIRGARISVMDAETGAMMYGTTNTFGYYTVNDLVAGSFYIVTISHKRYVFADDTRTLTLHEDFHGLDFMANPAE